MHITRGGYRVIILVVTSSNDCTVACLSFPPQNVQYPVSGDADVLVLEKKQKRA
jgi:hypothetical protein